MNFRNVLFGIFIFAAGQTLAQSASSDADCLDSLYIPASFTTCGDSANDAWEIYFPCEPQNFKIAIYNRWGVEVYKSTDYKFRWMAKDEHDRALPVGVYFYVIEFTFMDKEKKLNGSVNYIR